VRLSCASVVTGVRDGPTASKEGLLISKKSDSPQSSGAVAPRKPRANGSAQLDRRDLAAIVKLLRVSDALTRNDIESQTGLGRAAVAERLVALNELGLIDEGELGKTSGGRAPRLVRFNRNAGLVMVAVVGQTTLGMGVADLSGDLVFEHHESSTHNLSPTIIAKRLITLFDWALEQLQHSSDDVWSIALSVPGAVPSTDVQTAAVENSHGPTAWRGVPICEQLMIRYHASVHLRSRIQMMTRGENRRGGGAGASDLLVIDVGKEISAGLVSAGKLCLGAQFAAGMIGHSSIDDGNNKPCWCGNTGCLETEVGTAAIATAGETAAKDKRSEVLATVFNSQGFVGAMDVVQAAQNGDPFSAELLARSGRLLGAATAILVNVLNPSVVVLAGRFVQSGDVLLAAFRETVYRKSHPLVTRDLTIMRSQLGSSGSLVGAAIVAVDELFETNYLPGWIGTGTPSKHADLQSAIVVAKKSLASDSSPKPPTEPPIEPFNSDAGIDA